MPFPTRAASEFQQRPGHPRINPQKDIDAPPMSRHSFGRPCGDVLATAAGRTRARAGGGGAAERFIRTLKENLLWVRRFDTIEALRLALLAFKRTYNEQWMLEKYHYRSPAQVRRDLVGLAKAA